MREYTSETINPGPILIIKTPFQHFYSQFYFQHHFIPKIQNHIYFLSYTYKTQKYHSHIILLYCIVIYFIAYRIYFTYIHTMCLTTTRWSLGHKTRKLFCRCLKKNNESFFDCSPRIRYKPRVSSWGKFTLATTLCTWSPNKLAPCLVSSMCGSQKYLLL
jgi:hypothetical protein